MHTIATFALTGTLTFAAFSDVHEPMPTRCGTIAPAWREPATLVPVSTLPVVIDPAAVEPAPVKPVPVQLAICLDTSGSMQGLIDSARQKIWEIVNDLALADPAPKLTVALVTFGNDSHHPENGWVHVQTDFTEDLDLVSERLFALTTNGGTEYVGRVLDSARTSLSWLQNEDALKMIVVAGNESANQDPSISYRDASEQAFSAGVIVNSIYCGNPEDGIAPEWRDVAVLAKGHFASIDQNSGTVVINTPFDAKMTELSGVLNTTYIPYTDQAWANQVNQTMQDANAESLNSNAGASRAVSKSCGLYSCSSWDLIDACKDPEFKLEEVDREALPKHLVDMSLEELRAYIAKMDTQRAAVQKQILAIDEQRKQYIAEEMKKMALDESDAFDYAIRSAIREQAQNKGLHFADATPATDGADDDEADLEEADLLAVDDNDGC